MPAWQDMVMLVVAALVAVELLRARRTRRPTIVLGDRADPSPDSFGC